MSFDHIENNDKSDHIVQRIFGVILFLIGAAIYYQAGQLAVGSVRSPGPGFFPKIIVVGLMVLSLLLVVTGGSEDNKTALPTAHGIRQILLVLVALVLYTFALEYVGFHIVSFLLMTFLFAVAGSKKWYVAMAWAFCTIALTWFVFEFLLGQNFPSGILL